MSSRGEHWRTASIMTASGKLLMPFGPPEPHDIDIEDIAHALAMVCRWGGSSKYFYSVAQHSFLVSTIVEEVNAFAGLLHDASEAYIGDVTSPMKITPVFDLYRAEEAKLQQVILDRFGVGKMDPAVCLDVHTADVLMAAVEAEYLMPGEMLSYKVLNAVAVTGVHLPRPEIWSQREGKERFLKRYHELKP